MSDFFFLPFFDFFLSLSLALSLSLSLTSFREDDPLRDAFLLLLADFPAGDLISSEMVGMLVVVVLLLLQSVRTVLDNAELAVASRFGGFPTSTSIVGLIPEYGVLGAVSAVDEEDSPTCSDFSVFKNRSRGFFRSPKLFRRLPPPLLFFFLELLLFECFEACSRDFE